MSVVRAKCGVNQPDLQATAAALRATRTAMESQACMARAEFPELPGLLTEAASQLEALAARCEEHAREGIRHTFEINRLVGERAELRSKVAALEREAEGRQQHG